MENVEFNFNLLTQNNLHLDRKQIELDTETVRDYKNEHSINNQMWVQIFHNIMTQPCPILLVNKDDRSREIAR